MKDERRVILIIDDQQDDLFLFERALKKASGSLTIRTCNDGSKAIDYLDGKGDYTDRRRFPFPSVIFTDLKMNAVSGFDVIRHVKKHLNWAVIPLVVFSSSCDQDDIKRAYALGASAYNVKPQSAEERDRLARVLLDYWAVTEFPQIDNEGNLLATNGNGKIGEAEAGGGKKKTAAIHRV